MTEILQPRLLLAHHLKALKLPTFLREYDRNLTTFTVRPGTPLAEVEKLLIRQTLAHVTSNREEAAKALGISRRALQYKLKEYGLVE